MHDERIAVRQWLRQKGWWAMLALVAALLLAALPARAEPPSAVVLALPGDPYAPLAQEISAQEGLPLAHSLETALASGAETVIWVVAPGQLSEELLAQVGRTLASEREVALGLISGGSLEAARALWQRPPATSSIYVAAVPREGVIETHDGTALIGSVALTGPTLIEALATATLFSYQGHGSRREWHPEEEMHLTAGDVPPLAGLVVNADACQTMKLWGEDPIALAFRSGGRRLYRLSAQPYRLHDGRAQGLSAASYLAGIPHRASGAGASAGHGPGAYRLALSAGAGQPAERPRQRAALQRGL
jgi:hypothetical protein